MLVGLTRICSVLLTPQIARLDRCASRPIPMDFEQRRLVPVGSDRVAHEDAGGASPTTRRKGNG
jgi:hypothetical protein